MKKLLMTLVFAFMLQTSFAASTSHYGYSNHGSYGKHGTKPYSVGLGLAQSYFDNSADTQIEWDRFELEENESSFGFKLTGEWRFHENFAAEVGFTHHGSFERTLTGQFSEAQNSPELRSFSKYSVSSGHISAKMYYPVSSSFFVFGKLGLVHWRSKASIEISSTSNQKGWDWYYHCKTWGCNGDDDDDDDDCKTWGGRDNCGGDDDDDDDCKTWGGRDNCGGDDDDDCKTWGGRDNCGDDDDDDDDCKSWGGRGNCDDDDDNDDDNGDDDNGDDDNGDDDNNGKEPGTGKDRRKFSGVDILLGFGMGYYVDDFTIKLEVEYFNLSHQFSTLVENNRFDFDPSMGTISLGVDYRF